MFFHKQSLSWRALGSNRQKVNPAYKQSIAAVGWLVFASAHSLIFLLVGRTIDGMAAGNVSIAQSAEEPDIELWLIPFVGVFLFLMARRFHKYVRGRFDCRRLWTIYSPPCYDESNSGRNLTRDARQNYRGYIIYSIRWYHRRSSV